MRPGSGSLRLLLLGFVLAIGLLVTRTASAQLHWDLGAQVGVNKRFLGETRNVSSPTEGGFGPMAQLQGHVALLPLVRVGGYLGYEISPLTGDPAARDMFGGGLRVKIMSPWPRGDVRLWLFLGFGYQAVHARSYRTTSPSLQPSVTPYYELSVDGSGGHYWELPVGIGVSYKLRKPYQLFAELGARVGFSGQGTTYEGFSAARIDNLPPGTVLPPGARVGVLPSGDDRFSLGLSLGVMIDL